jgi:putative transposase
MITSAHDGYPQTSLRQLCALFGISRSWWYERTHAAAPDAEAVALRDRIEQIILDFPGYGYRRVTHALRRSGWQVNHKRVLRIMQNESLLCHLHRQFVVTTDSQHGYPTYPNLLTGLVVDALDQAWVADITYIRLPSGFVYLACILDAHSRRCIGWHLSRTIDTQLALVALNHAIATRQPAVGLIHHSDRGVQYASAAYVERLQQIGAQISMSAKGNPYDNAFIESFYKTLKYEEVHLWNYETYEDVIERLPFFIEEVYNRKRLHSSIGYVPPIEFEAAISNMKPADRPVLNL